MACWLILSTAMVNEIDWASCWILTNLTRYPSDAYCMAVSRPLQQVSRRPVFIRTSGRLLAVNTLFVIS